MIYVAGDVRDNRKVRGYSGGIEGGGERKTKEKGQSETVLKERKIERMTHKEPLVLVVTETVV